MAVNYKNSAGTDLDNLFDITNDNKGAIGYLTSGNQDLGNRYPSAKPLNQNVGYKNSAGTDIGYLRGKKPEDTITIVSANFSTAYYYLIGYSDGTVKFSSKKAGSISKTPYWGSTACKLTGVYTYKYVNDFVELSSDPPYTIKVTCQETGKSMDCSTQETQYFNHQNIFDLDAMNHAGQTRTLTFDPPPTGFI